MLSQLNFIKSGVDERVREAKETVKQMGIYAREQEK